MPRILSKKMKRKSQKGVSWAQMGRNKKLMGQVESLNREIAEEINND